MKKIKTDPSTNTQAKKIAVVTGSRAEYGLLKPIMTAIKKSSRLKLQLIVTGGHLHPLHQTSQDISNDGFEIDSMIDIQLDGATTVSMANSTGSAITQLAQAYEKLKPDLVFILGDRLEAFAATTSAILMNIPVAHYGGGQFSGSVDNLLRMAISKMAQLHFVKSPAHRDTLLALGEDPRRIFMVGDMRHEMFKTLSFQDKAAIVKHYSFDAKDPLLVVLFHPDTQQIKSSLKHYKIICEAIESLKCPTLFFIPNLDAGGKKMYQFAQDRLKTMGHVQIIHHLPQSTFFNILAIADLFIGNSSATITEAPYFELRSILIGDRQKNRERYDTIFEVDPFKEDLTKLIREILSDPSKRNPLFSAFAQTPPQTTTSQDIVSIIESLETPQLWLQK